MHLKWVSSFGKSTPCPTTPDRAGVCPTSTKRREPTACITWACWKVERRSPGVYLLPGWEPQRAVGMSSEPPPTPRCRVHRRGHGKPCTGCQGERRVGQGRPWLNPPKPEPEQTPKWEAPGRERRQVGTKTRRMRGDGSAVVLVGVTPHHGARESRVQGEAPKSGGRRSRATNRMRIWGNAPGEAGERRTDRSPPGVSRGMVKVICPVLTGRMGTRTC
jgi:hypothetical protein